MICIFKLKIINIFITFLLCFLFHFLYSWFPNFVFSIFFPVNESIWEHMKLLYSSIVFYGIIEYFIFKRKKINTNNYIFNLFVTAFLSIIIFLIIYIPFYNIFGENFILNISVLFITIVISQINHYLLLTYNKKSNLNYLGIIGIILSYFIFTFLTYYPVYNNLFYDSANNLYGINKKGP